MTSKTVYVVPATLLYEAAKKLQPPEKLCFVTGVKLLDGRIIILTQLVEVECAASRVHVAPDAASVFRAHQELISLGADIEGQFHSHPGCGPCATHPSSTDMTTAGRWESGAPFIGAIFSEGGRYVRFFNNSQRSEVMIYGKHIKTNEPNSFELPPIGHDTMSAEESEPGGLVVDRPAAEAFLVESEEDPKSEHPFGWCRRSGL